MKKIALSLITLLALNFASCSSDTTTTPTPAVTIQTVTATLTGANHVPAVVTTSVGAVTGTYNKTTKILSIAVTHNIAAPTLGHIHKAAAGSNGSVVFDFGKVLTSPINYTTTTALTDAQLADLTAGLFYVNIHTATNGGGEIRGQLSLK